MYYFVLFRNFPSQGASRINISLFYRIYCSSAKVIYICNSRIAFHFSLFSCFILAIASPDCFSACQLSDILQAFSAFCYMTFVDTNDITITPLTLMLMLASKEDRLVFQVEIYSLF